MLIGLMEILGLIYYWTWFIWPFLFVFGLAHGIAELIKEDKGSGNLGLAGFSLLMILASLQWPLMQ